MKPLTLALTTLAFAIAPVNAADKPKTKTMKNCGTCCKQGGDCCDKCGNDKCGACCDKKDDAKK